MERLIKAWQNSMRAFRRLLQTETAFQQEMGLLAVALPRRGFCRRHGATMRCS